MTIVLDTPEQITMWVLLSRRGQLHLHRKGLKVPGIVKWCKENLPSEYQPVTTADSALLRLNEYISDLGGPDDPEMNYQIFKQGWVNKRKHLWGWVPIEGAIFDSLADVAASRFADGIRRDAYLIGLTLDEVKQ